MTPDPEQRLPRELLKELIEEGSDAFREVLEKLLNTAMQMEREEFLGARRWERSEQRRDHANGYKAKTLSTRVGQLQIRIPQVRHLDFYPRSLERGCRSEKALKLAIAEMYVMGVSTRKVTEITEQLCGTEISASQVSRISKLLDDELEQFRKIQLCTWMPVLILLQLLGQAGGDWGQLPTQRGGGPLARVSAAASKAWSGGCAADCQR